MKWADEIVELGKTKADLKWSWEKFLHDRIKKKAIGI